MIGSVHERYRAARIVDSKLDTIRAASKVSNLATSATSAIRHENAQVYRQTKSGPFSYVRRPPALWLFFAFKSLE